MKDGLTFVGIKKIHSVKTDHSHLIGYNFNGVVATPLKHLKTFERYEFLPYPKRDSLVSNVSGVTDWKSWIRSPGKAING